MRSLILALLVLLGTVFVVTSAAKTEAAVATPDAAAIAEHVKNMAKPITHKISKTDKFTVNGKAKGVKSSKKIAEAMDVTDYKDAKMGVLNRGFYGSASYEDGDTSCVSPTSISFQRVNMCGSSIDYASEAKTVLGRWQKGSDDITVNVLTSSFDTDSCENLVDTDGYTAPPLDMCVSGLGSSFSTHIVVDMEKDFMPPVPGVAFISYQSKKGCEKMKERDIKLVNFFSSYVCHSSLGNFYRYECDVDGVTPVINYFETDACAGTATSTYPLTGVCGSSSAMLYKCFVGPASRKLRGEAK